MGWRDWWKEQLEEWREAREGGLKGTAGGGAHPGSSTQIGGVGGAGDEPTDKKDVALDKSGFGLSFTASDDPETFHYNGKGDYRIYNFDPSEDGLSFDGLRGAEAYEYDGGVRFYFGNTQAILEIPGVTKDELEDHGII